MIGKLSAYASWRAGIAWVRWGNRCVVLRAPWDAPLFSERYGYARVVARFRGWRVIVEKQQPVAPRP